MAVWENAGSYLTAQFLRSKLMFSYVGIQVLYFGKDGSEVMCSNTLYQEEQLPTSARTGDVYFEPFLEKKPESPALSFGGRDILGLYNHSFSHYACY